MLIYYDPDIQSAHFLGNPLCHATKRHVNNSYSNMVKNDEKGERNLSFVGNASSRSCFSRTLAVIFVSDFFLLQTSLTS